MIIVSLLGMALVFAIVSAINALGMHFAAQCAEAQYPDYKQTFLSIFYGYMLLLIVIFILNILKIANNFFMVVAWFGVLIWVINQLINKLGIDGGKNIIIFIGMSFFFNAVIGAILGMVF